MKIEIADINTIKPYENNPRKLSEQAIEKVAMSLKEYGFRQPIVVDKNNIIVAGHTRYRASKKLGYTKVPITIVDNLTPEQINAYRIADNRTAEESDWDNELLKMEIKELELKDFNLDLLGFNEDQLNEILFDEKQGLTDEDAVPETPIEPKTKLGDIYILENHRLMCGDSTSIHAVEKLINGQKADMVFTDPPYGIDYSGGRTQVVATKTYGKILNDNLEGEELGSLIVLAFTYIKQDADVYICVSPLKQKPFLDSIEKLNKKIDAVIVWDKKNAGLGYMKYRRQCEFILYVKGGDFKKGDKSDFDLWSISKDKTTEYIHGTQKPVALIERAINNSSKGDDIILDLFGGSGSTLIACEKLNRINHIMELDPKYCDVIVKRWEQFTGKKAKLENGQN
jgi:DNA modification methylase